MRRLALHASALSDAEYDFFTKSIREIADDATEHSKATPTSDDVRYEEISIGVREARAWFRGRYSRVSLSIIDGILKLFAPNLAREDVIDGTEFFAALRLVTHADNGKEIDRSLAFVQVNPPAESSSSIKRDSRSPSPTRVAEFLQATSLSSADNAASIMFTDSGVNNPFPILYPTQSQPPETGQHSAFNPFIHPNVKLPPLPPRKPHSSTSTSNNPHPPPPPPRHIADPRIERSISPSKKYSHTPPVPPKPSQHVTSTLIKQSLQARKIAQSLKKAEEQLDKERVLQVLKSSSIVTGAYPLAGASVVGSSVVIGTNIHHQHQLQHPTSGLSGKKGPGNDCLASSISSGSESGQRPEIPPLPKRPRGHPPSQQHSPRLSDGSLEQVALASSLPLPGSSLQANAQDYANPQPNPFDKEEFPNHPLPAPPPTHPDRNPTFGYHQLNPSPKTPSDPPPQLTTQNLETFDAIYGAMTSEPISSFRSGTGESSRRDPVRFPPNSDTVISTDSQTKPIRSLSLSHQGPGSQAPLPPPVRRKRPESAQLYGIAGDTSRSLSRHTSLRSTRGVGHRKSSLSLSSASSFKSHTTSPFTDDNTLHRLNSGVSTNSIGGNNNSASGIVGTNIQRTIEALHHIHGQLQPKLEKARYKAEAGLSRRGFVRSAVRSSGEESPTAVESEEQESLTKEPQRRWLEPHIGGSLRAQEMVDGEESESDADSEQARGRTSNTSVHPDGTPSNNHQYLRQRSPETYGDESRWRP